MTSRLFLIVLLGLLSGCQYYSLPDSENEVEVYYVEMAEKEFIDYSLLENLQFNPYHQQKINFDAKGSTVVFKVSFKNIKALKAEHVWVVEHKYLDKVSYLTQNEQGDFMQPQVQIRLEPTPSRLFSSERFVFNAQNQDIKDHYIIVQSRRSSVLSISLIEKDSYISHDKSLVIFFTLLYSSMLGLFLVNFIYYFWLYVKSSG